MDGMNSYFHLFILFTCAIFSSESVDRRFSDFKRCADDECSMLLCRGKAAKDFTGPDCRFLSFKTGETIFVYYKLSGQRSDMWAGSVGSSFGYFPKDFLNINHIYTEKEIEVPAEETDFVCFDTGLDTFESYNIDALLSNSELLKKDNKPSKETKEMDQNENLGHDVQPVLEESFKDTGDGDVKNTEQLDKESTAEKLDLHPVEPSFLPMEPTASEDQYVVSGTDDSPQNRSDGTDSDVEPTVTKDIPDSPKDSSLLEKSERITEAEAIPKLKTTLGTTFDAVTSDDEDTRKVTLYEDDGEDEESNELADKPSERGDQILKEPPLLPFAQSPPHTESNDEQISPNTAMNIQKNVLEANNGESMLSSLGYKASKTLSDSKIMDLPEDGEIMDLMEDDASGDDDDDEEEEEENIDINIDTDVSEKDSQDLLKVQDLETNKVDIHTHTNNVHDSKDDTKVSEQESTTEIQETKSSEKLEHSSDKVDLAETLNNAAVQTDKSKNDSEDLLKVQIQDPETSKVEDKHFSHEPVDEDPNLVNDSKYVDVSEHESTTQIQEIKIKVKSELSNKDLNLAEISNEAAVQSEPDAVTPTLRDEEQTEEKTDQSEYDAEDLQRIKFQDPETADKHSTSEAAGGDPISATDAKSIQASDQEYRKEIQEIKSDEKSEESNRFVDLADDINDAVQSEPDDLAPNLDNVEQTDMVKNDVLLPEETLTKGNPETEVEPEVYEEKEDTEQLLEDENAMLASKTELSNKAEKPETLVELNNGKQAVQLENHEMVVAKPPNSPKQTNDNASEQLDEDGKTDSETTLELSNTLHEGESSVQSVDSNYGGKVQHSSTTAEEPEYSDTVLRLTLLREHFKDDEIERILRHLTLKDLFRVESMFVELEQELMAAKHSYSQSSDDLKKKLDDILEISENAILEEIDKMLDVREQRALKPGQPMDSVMLDEEAVVLDEFHEFLFSLRQKYTKSVPLVEESQSHIGLDKLKVSEEIENSHNMENTLVTEPTEIEVHEEADEVTVNSLMGETLSQDMGLEEDGGHFNKNEDIQTDFQDKEEIQRGPQPILDNPLDIPFGFEMDTSSGSLDTPRTSDLYDNNARSDQAHTSSSDQVLSWFLLCCELLGVYTEILIAALPEEWQPGPTFHGLPWKPVVVTAAVGILTAVVFMWRTILAIKGRTYLLTEKQLAERVQQLVSEKSDVLSKITELNDMIKQHEETLKNSEKSKCSTQKELDNLKSSYKELCNQREELSVSFSQLKHKISNTQEEKTSLIEKISIMHKEIEKYQNTLKLYDEERSKVRVVMDEAKFREDALKAQVLALEKDNSALKDQKIFLLNDAKDWKEKHDKLSEEIKVYHKTQKELEDALVHKENEIDVLSGCISELQSLEACGGTEIQKGDVKVTNGNTGDRKGDPIRLRLKQMMDVSRIKTMLSVIEEERNRCLENFLAEQKARQELEEQFQTVLHDQTRLKNEKTHLENQYKNLQQRLEITTELYQQKENALQQKLTQEELERREKETKLSEVDSQAVQAEEELTMLRKKVKEMQEEMQQNEKALKAEIANQEKKAHENWLKARASERSLIEERRESAKLRQKIVECSDKMSDLEHALYKSGPPVHHIPLRRGDSYGPSPVSCGAPSPPLMIEGPGRPPSAPVGRKSEPFGPRPPPDAHGHFSELGQSLPSRPEVLAPRTSSPCIQDGSVCRSQNQESFLPSPIRDSPVTASNAPPKVYGPMGGSLPPLSNGPLPPMIRPPNGHPSMIPPGLPFGLEPRFRPPPPMRPFGPIPPPLLRGLPPRDMIIVPPLTSGMHDFPPDLTGPCDLPFPPMPFPPGPLPPPGTKAAPPFGVRGQDPPMPPSEGRDRTHATDISYQKRDVQNTTTSTTAEP